MSFQPLPCDAGSGSGADVEQLILCDLDAEGTLLGTALAVYEYGPDGTPVGPPTFVDPATGLPYVVQGTLQPCPGDVCLPPLQFCQTSTSTGPVEHPGRQYDLTLPVNPGFGVESLLIDAVTHPAGITWGVADVDGEEFRQQLTTFMQGRVPAGATVTITNPNAGGGQVCGTAQPMTVHIECVRLDQDPPGLIELVYNGGLDLIQNPGYNEDPEFNIHQPCGFHLLRRQDNGGTLECTNVANRGWETNDDGQTFEIWCDDVRTGQGTTTTPRGTPVQEVNSDGHGTTGTTIWQTFQVGPAQAGNFRLVLVHGARDPGETHTIRLSTGDTDDSGTGDIINNVTVPPSVTNSGGPNPWTTFDQTVPLGAGTYTFSFHSTNGIPGLFARGGLFSDMRAYIDRPGQRATATTDDETCVVTTQETTTTTTCSWWQPQCAGGHVVGWEKVDTGETLSNAEFWAQVPTPECCTGTAAAAGEGSATLSNMITSDLVCATVGGVARTAIRVITTNPSGGILSELIVGTDGTPLAPSTWSPGPCVEARTPDSETIALCDSNGTRFLRTYVYNAAGAVADFTDTDLDGGPFVPAGGPVGACGQTVNVQDIRDSEQMLLCDANDVPFVRTFVRDGLGAIISTSDVTLDGAAIDPVEPVGRCADCCPTVLGEGCWNDGTTTGQHTAIRLPDGTVELLDQADGHVVAPADVVACTGEPLAAHLVDVTPGSPWTPAEIPAGATLTGLSLSVVTGTADVVDANGTAVANLPAGYAAAWEAPADGVLTPPQSITADAASRVVVVMAVRP